MKMRTFEFCEKRFTLNSLSITCKKLYELDIKRRQIQMTIFKNKFGYFPEKYIKRRINFPLLEKVVHIGELKYCNMKLILVFPKLYEYLYDLKIDSFSNLNKVSPKRICKVLKLNNKKELFKLAKRTEVCFAYAAFAMRTAIDFYKFLNHDSSDIALVLLINPHSLIEFKNL